MKKAVVLPAAAVIGGLLGLVCRQWQWKTAFEPGTGLPVSGSVSTYALWVVVILTAAALLFLCRGQHRAFEKCYTSAFRPGDLTQAAGVMAGMALFAVAGFVNVETFVTAGTDPFTGARTVSLMRPILGVVCLLTAAGVWFTVQKMKTGQVDGAWVLLPGLTACLWVMSVYPTAAQSPVLQEHAPLMLAILAAMLSGYFLPAFAFGKGNVTLSLFFPLLSAALGITVAGDPLSLADLSLVLAFAFYHLGMAATLAHNDAKPIPAPTAGVPTCGGSCQGCTGCGPAPEAAVSAAELTEIVQNAPQAAPAEAPKVEYVINLPDNEI